MKTTRISRWLGFCSVLLAVNTTIQAEEFKATLTMAAPLSCQVFQRGKEDAADILVEGTVSDNAEVIEAKADLVQGAQRGAPVKWIALASQDQIVQGKFSGRLKLASGGWYQVTIRARVGDRIIAQQAVDKVGVGEVFVTAGQSNSANFGNPKQKAKDDRVVYFDGKGFVHAQDPIPGGCGFGGSPWALLGDRITASQQVPVCFRSASLSWTAVKAWLPPDTALYKNLSSCVQAFGKDGIRAVLWHQGESDTLVKTSAETYCERIKTIGEALNKDAGYQIPWLVAQASFHPGSQAPAQAEVAKGQKLLWNQKICFQGPVTDDLLGAEYRHDGVHFNQKGLAKHSERWFDALGNAFTWKTYSSSKPLAGSSFSASGAEVVLDVDWEKFLAAHDMVWTEMPDGYATAPLIGNGVCGTFFFKKGNVLRFEMNRSDFVDHRGIGMYGTGGATALFSRGRLPNGYFSLDFGEAVSNGQFRLDLWNAEVRGEMRTSAGAVKLRTFAHNDDVIVLELVGNPKEYSPKWEWNPYPCESSRGKPTGYKAYPPQEVKVTEGVNVSVLQMPENEDFRTVGRGVGQFATAWQVVETGSGRTIYISMKFSYPGATAAQTAVAAVKKAVGLGVASLEASHRSWWHEYYPKSFLSLPDRRAESYYWIQIYKLASATRAGGVMLDLAGPWYNKTPWPGVWWNMNLQQAYTPVFSANRMELAGPLLDALYSKRAQLEKNAEVFGPGAYGIDRVSGLDLDGKVEKGGEIGNLAYALNTCWQLYRATMDDAMLREKLFPLFKGAFKLFWNTKETDADGRFHIPANNSPETGPVADSNYSLSSATWLANTLLWSGSRLKLDDPVLEECRSFLKNRTPYPRDGTFGFYLGKNNPLKKPHRHWSHLFMIYPYREYTLDDPEKAVEMKRSLDAWKNCATLSNRPDPFEYSGFGEPAYAEMAGNMSGNGNVTLEMLNWYFDFERVEANTFWNFGGAPVIETPFFNASVTADMVLMSYNDMIRVFPAIPTTPEWGNVAFHNMRAEGAFLVSAKRESGATRFIRIESLTGELCRVKHDFKGEVKTLGKRPFVMKDLGKGIVELDLKKGEAVVLYSGELPELVIAPVKANREGHFWGKPKGWK